MASPLRALLSFVLFLIVVPAAAQAPIWSAVPQADGPTYNPFRHDDVKFSDTEKGWVVNQLGQIWRTLDSGDSWQLQLQNTTLAFRSVAAIDDQTAFVGTIVTPNSVLFKTEDGGTTWNDITDRITGDAPAAICGLWAVNERVIYGVGAYYGVPRFVTTRDGGATWTSKSTSPIAETLVDVHFFDEMEGIVIGGSSGTLEGNTVIIRTTDGGETWTKVHESPRPSGVDGSWGWKISFPSRLIGYVSEEWSNNPEDHEASVLKTTDGGLTWTKLLVDGSVSHAGLQSVGFVTDEIGWASGRGISSVTEDGGDTWRQLDHFGLSNSDGQLDGSVNKILVVNDTFSVAVGQYVHRLMGPASGVASDTTPTPPSEFELLPVYANPFSRSITQEFIIERSELVRISVIDPLGRVHALLQSGILEAGRHSVTWNGKSADGTPLASGAYFFLINIGDAHEIKQTVWLR